MKLYLATSSEHKHREYARLLVKKDPRWRLYTARDIGGMPEVIEDEETFYGNALKKAIALRKKVSKADWVLADDSGLEVDALSGAPGVHSARFAGEKATDAENISKLLFVLGNKPPEQRYARFRCTLALIDSEERAHVFEGVCSGTIAPSSRGTHGFGYDPVFIPDGCTETFGQLDDTVKDTISHRARACQKFLSWLESQW